MPKLKKKSNPPYFFLLVVLLAAILIVYLRLSPSKSKLPPVNDPFAYCREIGTIDKPAYPYTGPEKPEMVLSKLKNLLNMSGEVLTNDLKAGTFWRCMNNKVYACFVGANLPCQAKANVDKTPTAEMISYCQSNPNSDFIPAVVTGHETIYAWSCNNASPQITKQVFQTDKQGFISDIWYEIGN